MADASGSEPVSSGTAQPKEKKGIQWDPKSLAFLDGTTLSFGSRGRQYSIDSFTKEDLIAGLKAAATGTPMDDYLPATQWEAYAASVFEVLLDKHLVFFGEINQALSKKKTDED